MAAAHRGDFAMKYSKFWYGISESHTVWWIPSGHSGRYAMPANILRACILGLVVRVWHALRDKKDKNMGKGPDRN